MSGLGVSIKRPKAEEEVKNTATATITPQTAQPEEDYIFNERDINYYWQEYTGRMPKEQVAIAKRMQNMHITLLNATTFEAVVDNENCAKRIYLDDSPITRVPTYPPEKPQGNHECTYQHSH